MTKFGRVGSGKNRSNRKGDDEIDIASSMLFNKLQI